MFVGPLNSSTYRHSVWSSIKLKFQPGLADREDVAAEAIRQVGRPTPDQGPNEARIRQLGLVDLGRLVVCRPAVILRARGAPPA